MRNGETGHSFFFFLLPPPFLPRTLIKKGIEINKNTSRKNKNKKKTGQSFMNFPGDQAERDSSPASSLSPS
jgi:hypothetical protein